MKRRGVAMAVLVTAALAVAACGSDGDGPERAATETATATAAAAAGDLTSYRAAANRACRAFAVTNDRLSRDPGIPANLREQAAYDTQLARAVDVQARAFAAIDPPPGAENRDRHAALTQTYVDTAAAYREGVHIAEQGDAEGYQAATQRRQTIGNEQLRLANELSADTCSRALPLKVRGDIETLTRRVLLGEAPERSCADDVTPAFVASNLEGSRASCLKILRGLARDGATVEVTYITGVDRLFATTNVLFAETKDTPPKKLSYDLSWDSTTSSWRFDAAYDPKALLPEG